MKKLKQIRFWLSVFIAALFLSGLTALPIDSSFLLKFFSKDSEIYNWLHKLYTAYGAVKETYPFLLYGYDWLAFAHFILAILFIGPYRDPVKNIWVIEFGLIACILIFPLAFIAGYFRGIPLGWRLIDCSFGFFGFIPLWICYRKTKLISSKHQNKIYGNVFGTSLVKK